MGTTQQPSSSRQGRSLQSSTRLSQLRCAALPRANLTFTRSLARPPHSQAPTAPPPAAQRLQARSSQTDLGTSFTARPQQSSVQTVDIPAARIELFASLGEYSEGLQVEGGDRQAAALRSFKLAARVYSALLLFNTSNQWYPHVLMCVMPRLIVEHGDLWRLSCEGNEALGKFLGQEARGHTWKAASTTFVRGGQEVHMPSRGEQLVKIVQTTLAVKQALAQENHGVFKRPKGISALAEATNAVAYQSVGGSAEGQ